MSQIKYIYNPKTLRYEPARLAVGSVVVTTLGLLAFGFLFFAALVWIQNLLVETPIEKSLLAENASLVEYKTDLSEQLLSANLQLDELKLKDRSLYEKIFEAKKTEDKPVIDIQADKEILLSDGSAFRSLTKSLTSRSTDLYATAAARNDYFSSTAGVKKSDLALLASTPSFPPLADFDATKLVSGYGIRINPFHKGKYHHDGIDLAAARGSEVLAAAKGTVINVSYSELQAGFGNYVTIDHDNGYVTHYANLGTTTVQYGQRVTKGQSVGTIGISGGSVAPHVHYEVLKNGKNVDPVKFLVHGITAVAYESIWQASRKQNQSLD